MTITLHEEIAMSKFAAQLAKQTANLTDREVILVMTQTKLMSLFDSDTVTVTLKEGINTMSRLDHLCQDSDCLMGQNLISDPVSRFLLSSNPPCSPNIPLQPTKPPWSTHPQLSLAPIFHGLSTLSGLQTLPGLPTLLHQLSLSY